MNGTTGTEVKEFAAKLLRDYYCEGNVEFLISRLDEEVIWLASGVEQEVTGRDRVAEWLRQESGSLPRCRMAGESYTLRELGEGTWLCVGESLLEAQRPYLYMRQHTTFVFARRDDGIWVAHIHASVKHLDTPDGNSPLQETYENMQDALSRKDREIELMISQLPGGMMLCSREGKFLIRWVSVNLSRLLGYSSPEELFHVAGGDMKNLLVEGEDKEIFARAWEQIERKGSYNVEYQIRRKDGSLLWVSDFGKAGHDQYGEENIYCFLSDITEKKKKEMEIARANQDMRSQARFLKQLYDTIPCGILQFTPGPSYQVVSVNRMVWEFYGFESEEEYHRVVRNPFQMVLDKDKEGIERTIHGLELGGGTVSYTRDCLRADGSRGWISVVMERIINADGLDVVQAVFTDVTELQLIQIEQEKEQLIENRSLRAAICTVYPLILNINLTKNTFDCFIEEGWPYVGKRRGSYDELVGESAERMYPAYRKDFEETFERQKVMRRYLDGEREIYQELQIIGIDGEYHWISIQLIYVENPVNRDMLAIELVKVLDSQRTEQARQEMMLRDALAVAQQANHAKSDFLSRMSHDIRTPMNAIIGMSALGQMKLDDPLRVQDCFGKIDASCRYLLSLINDILDMSKIETGKMDIVRTRFDFKELIGEIYAIIYPQVQEKKQSFEMCHEETMARYYVGDALRLKQILMNLLSNALKFTLEGGRIWMEIREQRRANGFILIEITVKDTGIGMSEKFQERLFQPFEQETTERARNNVGSGLGLSIVNNLVQLMGGTIHVESKQGKGSCFTVVLPFEVDGEDEGEVEWGKPEKPGSANVLPKPDFKGQRVLMAEDNALNAEIAKALLEQWGLRVDCTGDGRETLERFKTSEEGYYGAVLMDVRMPLMDGLEATRAIRSLKRRDAADVPILAMTANAFEEDRAVAMEAGMTGYLVKPLDMGAMLRELERVLGAAGKVE